MTIVARHIPEQPHDGRRLGRHVEHDDRSRAYPARWTAGGPLRRVMWRRHGRLFDQGQTGSCTGNAVAGAVNTDPLATLRGGHPLLHESDAKRIYALATALDLIPGEFPPDDTGSSGLAACKAAKRLGLLSGYRHAFGIDHALAALQVGPVVTGVDWYEGFDQPDEHGLVDATGQVRGGHEFEVLGYDPDTRLVRCANSWGSGWGDRGYFTLTADTWDRLLHGQGDVTVPVVAAV